MRKRAFNRLGAAIALGLFLAAVLVSIASAFAEEPIFFRDPYTGEVDLNTKVSTIHTDLTYVLALAAGFSIDDSRTLMIWDQLVDSNQINLNSAIIWIQKAPSNCSKSGRRTIGTNTPMKLSSPSKTS